MKDSYSITEIATMTGLTTRTLRNYLSDGQITAEKRDGKWIFSAEDFFRLLDSPYVAAAIRAKNNAPVLDFLKNDKKKADSVCMIIDRHVSAEEARELSEKICTELNEAPDVTFRMEMKEGRMRIILSGEAAPVDRIWRLLRG